MDVESVASLLARIEGMRAALAPFAEFCRGFESRTDAHVIASTVLGHISVRDLRRARAALEE